MSMYRDQFEAVNGFSNSFHGWGGEDDNFASRLIQKGFEIFRFDPTVASYLMLPHSKQIPSSRRFQESYADGLSTLNFTWTKVEHKNHYTRIIVTW